ncbi:hypothetical protein J3R30DRAFT_3701134 [Lentinula aciculospora]|uniref:LysM domain-containing protein n=1 Tax=Lentinula aciculospora TaxID=153920 RepID=A0A9W9AD68_9AGAR|nr:hypothetical protein J3R30DRAFT_3701134 [Lentinula aciculospora]
MTISLEYSTIFLCFACSSSLPPRSHTPAFTTQCCQKPICSSCISANPRLARYNPCLACLGGVQVVGSRRNGGKQQQLASPEKINIDGAMRDEDTFVLGDDEEDEENLDENGAALPPYVEQSSSQSLSSLAQATDLQRTNLLPILPKAIDMKTNTHDNTAQYYIQRGDTVHGIALRFGVDGRGLCRLNKLPPSTLSTTPHLLHTRTVLTLPASARLKDQNGRSLLPSHSDDAEERLRAVRRTREPLAEGEDVEGFRMRFDLKQKERDTDSNVRNAFGIQASNLELMAIDKYFEDNEWEERQERSNKASCFLPSIK